MVLLVLVLPSHLLRSVVDDNIRIHLEKNPSFYGAYSSGNFWERVNKTLNDLMLESNDDMDFESYLGVNSKYETTNDFGQKKFQAVSTNPFIASKKSTKFNSKAIRFYLEDAWLDSLNDTETRNISLSSAHPILNVSHQAQRKKEDVMDPKKESHRNS
jgi:hypothetical protein